jgi:UDP-N-acetylglucosamine 3-dehydrogenase
MWRTALPALCSLREDWLAADGREGDLVVNALVVGNGVMGKHHARTLRRLGVEVRTLDPSGKAGADHRMLTEGLIDFADIVCVATPPAELAEVAALWLERGKSVLVEKPMAVDLEQAQRLLQAELATEGTLRIGYTERWNPAVHMLKESLSLIGEVRHVTAKRLGLKPRCSRTGPALDLLTHDIDVLRFLDLWPQLEEATATDCSIAASFRLSSGTATLFASHCHEDKQRSLTVVGTKGIAELDYQRQSLVITTGSGVQEMDVLRQEPLAMQWQAFLQGEGVSSGNALVVLKLALQAAQVERGGPFPRTPPPASRSSHRNENADFHLFLPSRST